METSTDFEFYIKFTKPLVLNLKEIKDRVLAAAWVKKLMQPNSGEVKVRLQYLKLFLFSLQRKCLVPPFSQHPNAVEVPLAPFPEEYTLVDMAKEVIAKGREEENLKASKGDAGDYPPYVSDFSADLLEYVAVQHITDFGVHGYYAVSKLPLNTWHRVDKHFLPKAAKSMIEVSPGPPPALGTASDSQLIEKSPDKAPEKPPEEAPEKPKEESGPEETTEEEGERPPEEKPESPKPSPKKKEGGKKSTMGATPPSRPIGKVSPPKEDREPPTWGSNLLEVKHVLDKEDDESAKQTSSPDLTEVLFKSMSPKRDIFYETDEYGGGIESEQMDFDDLQDISDTSILSFSDMQLSPDYGGTGTPSPLRRLRTPQPEAPGVTEETISPVKLVRAPVSQPPRPASQIEPPAPAPPRILTPPPREKKVFPKAKPTRASLLLQKKKAEKAQPPPPPPKKVVKRRPPPPPRAPPSKPKKEEAPSKAELPKKPSLTKKTGPARGKKPKGPVKTAADMVLYSPGEPFRGYDHLDEMDAELEQYQKMLREVEDEYQEDKRQIMERYPKEEAPKEVPKPKAKRSIPTPKMGLSRLARRSSLPLPKSHAAPVRAEAMIDVSEEARGVLVEAASAGSPYDEAPSQRPLTPRIPPGVIKSEEEEREEEEEERGVEQLDAEEEEDLPTAEELAEWLSTAGPGKDCRIRDFYNEMVKSIKLVPIMEEGLEEEGDLDVNLADISGQGEDIDGALQEFQAQEGAQGEVSTLGVRPWASLVPEEGEISVLQASPSDFEATEKELEEQMRSKGQDPRKRAKEFKRDLPALRKQYLGVHARADAQLEQLMEPEAEEEDDFEAMERWAEQAVRLKGEDPGAREKKLNKKKAYDAAKKMYLETKGKAYSQQELLEMADRPEAEYDFETMEKMIEEEMKLAGQDPGAREKKKKPLSKKGLQRERKKYVKVQKKIDSQMEELDKGVTMVREKFPRMGQAPDQQDLGGLDEEQWVWGPEFFKDQPTAQSAEEAFPTVDFAEDFLEEDVGDLELAPQTPPTPERRAQMQQEVEKLYQELLKSCPGLAGVPVTTPRPGTTPQRRRPIDLTYLKLTPPKEPPDPFGLPSLVEVKKEPTLSDYVEAKRKKKHRLRTPPLDEFTKISRTPGRTLSEISPPSADDEELVIYKRDLHDEDFVTPKRRSPSPEKVQLESPPRDYQQLKDLRRDFGEKEVSPPSKSWYLEMKERRKRMFGSPEEEEQKYPTIFDIPVDRMAGESPPGLVPMERSPLSPPIDPAALREHISRQRQARYRTPYSRRVGPKRRLVKRYSHPVAPLEPVEERPDLMTEGDLMFQEFLKNFEKTKRGREIFRFPGNKARKFIQRHAPPPRLNTIREVKEPYSPKIKTEIFDEAPQPFPWEGISPPDTFFETKPESPEISPIDAEQLKAEIRAKPQTTYRTPYMRKVSDRHYVERKSPAPNLRSLSEALEDLPEEEWDLRNRIERSGRIARKLFPRQIKKPDLSVLSEQVEYGPSPVTRRVSPEEDRRRPRRPLRKNLRRRRIDFSQPSSPDEAEMEAEHLVVEVGEADRELAALEAQDPYRTPPRRLDEEQVPSDIDDLLELTPPSDGKEETEEEAGEEVSPRTPPTNVLEQVHPPEELDELIELTPPSPMSEYGRLEGIMREVKDHVLVPPRVRRRKIRDMKTLRRGKMPQVEEAPIEERAAIIHDELEAEVDRELEEERERQKTYMDQPVPEGLPSPMKPQKEVPFYKTPPELRRRETPKAPQKTKQLQIWPTRFKHVLDFEEPPGMVPQDTPSPPVVLPPLDRQVEYWPRPRDSSGSPTLTGEEAPREFASPVSPIRTAADMNRIAQHQYSRLGGQQAPQRQRTTSQRPAAASPDEEFEMMERLAQQPDVDLLDVYSSPGTREFEQLEAMAAAEQGAADTTVVTVGPVESGASPGRVRRTAEAQYAALAKGTGIPKSMKGIQDYIRRMEEKETQQTAAQEPQPGPSSAPDTITFEYQEVSEQPKKKEEKAKTTKGTATKGAPLKKRTSAPKIAVRPTRTSAARVGSATTVKEAPKAAARPKSAGKGKPGAKKGKAKAKKGPEPVEAEYDMEALQRLGITPEHMRRLNLYDRPVERGQLRPPRPIPGRRSPPPPPHPMPLPVRPTSPDSPPPEHMQAMYEQLKTTDSKMHPLPIYLKGEYLPTKYKFMVQRLPKVKESADEDKRQPMGWDMKWHLSPQTRVDMRAPEVQVPPSPPKLPKLRFEEAKLVEPPKPRYQEMLPLVEAEKYADPGLTYTRPPEEIVPPSDITDRAWEYHELDVDYDEFKDAELDTETVPEDLDASLSPDEGDIEMEEFYDPNEQKLKKVIKIRGKVVSYSEEKADLDRVFAEIYGRGVEEGLQGESPPEIVEPGESPQRRETSPRKQQTPPRPKTPSPQRPLTPKQATPKQPTPKPPTPSPEAFMRRMQGYEYDPDLWRKKKKKAIGKYRPRLSPPLEDLEALSPQRVERVHPLGITVPAGYEDVGGESPPLDYYTAKYGRLAEEAQDYEEAEDDEEEEGQEADVSPPEFYSPKEAGGLVEDDEFADWEPQDLGWMAEAEAAVAARQPPAAPAEPPMSKEEAYRYLMPSPPKVKKLETRPMEEGFDLPEVVSHQPPPKPPRPKKRSPPRLTRRQQQESPPSPEGPSVQILVAEAEVHPPPRERSPREATPPRLEDEYAPDLIYDYEYVELFDTPPREDLPFGGRTSPGVYDTSPIHYEEEIPEHLRDFKWMDQK